MPVYDSARRFDILGRILRKKDAGEGTLHAELTLRPIAGFKGETSEDGDPDSAPRKVDLLVTNDGRMMPLSITVPVYFMPLVVQFVHFCASPEACPHRRFLGAGLHLSQWSHFPGPAQTGPIAFTIFGRISPRFQWYSGKQVLPGEIVHL
jgi:hypothetical protein